MARKAMTPQRAEKLAGGREALARQLAGLPAKGPLPKMGTPERTAYRSASRAIQRAEAAGKVNPKTGKPVQSRPGRRVEEAGEAIAERKRRRRKKTVTLRNARVRTRINGEPRYDRIRALGDVEVTQAQYRWIMAFRDDEDEGAIELLTELMTSLSPKMDDLAAAPGVYTLDISDLRFSSVD
jgi:hypothetical protein